MKYACFYYSATGNTRRAVELLCRGLEEEGSSVDAVLIRKGIEPPALDGYGALIVAFPVLAFSPPVFVTRFLRSLPRANMPAYVLAVDGGGGGSAAARAVRALQRRGFSVKASARASYPDNWTQLVEPSSPERAASMAREGDVAVTRFIGVVSSGGKEGSVDSAVSPLDATMGFLFGSLGRRFLGKLFYADEDCNACGICARNCPSATIVLGQGKKARPFWKMDCENCNACINACPRKAINTSIGRMVLLAGVIVASAWTGIWTHFSFLKPALAGVVPPVLGVVTDIFIVTAIILIAHVFPSALLDRFVVRWLQRLPGIRRFFCWTFTKNWRRYTGAALSP